MTQRQDQLVDFYRSALNAFAITSKEDGSLHHYWVGKEGADERPMSARFTAGGSKEDRKLYLPIQEVLKKGPQQGQAVFHPLSEIMFRGESEVIRALKKYMEFRISSIVVELAHVMAELAADGGAQKKMGSKKLPLLESMPEANDKTTKIVNDVCNLYFEKICKVHIVRSRKLGDTTYRRIASVSFPIIDMIDVDSTVIQEIKVGSKKNMRQIRGLFEYILSPHDNMEAWSFGTDDESFPNFISLLGLMTKVAGNLNNLVKIFKSHLDQADYLEIDVSFAEQLEDLGKYKAAVPAMEGNKGAPRKGESEDPPEKQPQKPLDMSNHGQQTHRPPATHKSSLAPPRPYEAPAPMPMPQPMTQPMQQPMAPQQSHSQPSGGKVSWNDLRGRMPSTPAQPMGVMQQQGYPQQQQPMGMGYPQQQQMGYPQQQQPMGMGYPQQQQPMGMGYPQQPQMGYPQQQQPMGYPQQQPMQGNYPGGYPSGSL